MVRVDVPGGDGFHAELLCEVAQLAVASRVTALERPLEQDRRADTGPSLVGPLALLGLVGLYLVGSSASEAWLRGDWLWVLELVGGAMAVLISGAVALRWLRRRELVDPRLVQAKLSRDACVVEVRLARPRLSTPVTGQVDVEVQLTIAFGFSAAAIGAAVREAVIRRLQDLTGLTVDAVEIVVADVSGH